DEQDVATRRGPGEPGRDADAVVLQQLVAEVLAGAQELLDPARVDLDLVAGAAGDADRDLAAQGGELALEVPQAGLFGVARDDGADAVVGEVNGAFRDAVLQD